jgi:competence protein ComEA
LIKEVLNNLKSYFEISNFERRGVYSLLFIVTLFAFFYWFKNNYSLPEENDNLAAKLAFAEQAKNSFGEKPNYQKRDYTPQSDKRSEVSLSFFNPNKDSYEELVTKGVNARVARNIVNFRSKGGMFKDVASLSKLYTISPEYYTQLKPFVQIDDVPDAKQGDKINVATKENPQTPLSIIILDINSATTEDLMKLKGIGKYYAGKIARDVNWKGGYYSLSQLYNIQDIPKETIDNIIAFLKVDATKIVKIKLNTADFAALRKHPYLTYKEVQAIINYREQHGGFQSFTELQKIHLLKTKDFNQVLPYLDLN